MGFWKGRGDLLVKGVEGGDEGRVGNVLLEEGVGACYDFTVEDVVAEFDVRFIQFVFFLVVVFEVGVKCRVVEIGGLFGLWVVLFVDHDLLDNCVVINDSFFG